MIIKTPKGSIFDTSKQAKSNLVMVLNDKGQPEMDVLTITGNVTIVMEFMEETAMIEVDGAFGTTEVNEDYIWQ